MVCRAARLLTTFPSEATKPEVPRQVMVPFFFRARRKKGTITWAQYVCYNFNFSNFANYISWLILLRVEVRVAKRCLARYRREARGASVFRLNVKMGRNSSGSVWASSFNKEALDIVPTL